MQQAVFDSLSRILLCSSSIFGSFLMQGANFAPRCMRWTYGWQRVVGLYGEALPLTCGSTDELAWLCKWGGGGEGYLTRTYPEVLRLLKADVFWVQGGDEDILSFDPLREADRRDTVHRYRDYEYYNLYERHPVREVRPKNRILVYCHLHLMRKNSEHQLKYGRNLPVVNKAV